MEDRPLPARLIFKGTARCRREGGGTGRTGCTEGRAESSVGIYQIHGFTVIKEMDYLRPMAQQRVGGRGYMPGVPWSCDPESLECYADETRGEFPSVASCVAFCGSELSGRPGSQTAAAVVDPPIIRYRCDASSGKCHESADGKYRDPARCSAACARYACDRRTGTCRRSARGPYKKLGRCLATCSKDDDDDDGLSNAAISGIVVGSATVVALLAAVFSGRA